MAVRTVKPPAMPTRLRCEDDGAGVEVVPARVLVSVWAEHGEHTWAKLRSQPARSAKRSAKHE